MSLVGPRPSPFRENQVCVPWRAARLSVRPGITGFWQVCRHNRSAGDFHQWIEYDLLYVQHLSFVARPQDSCRDGADARRQGRARARVVAGRPEPLPPSESPVRGSGTSRAAADRGRSGVA